MATRRFAVMPSIAILLAVSGVVIVDSPPPVPANAAPFGKICVVGELEDGPFETPTDMLTDADQPTIFGGFGFTYGSSEHLYACALANGGTEPWNGNVWVQSVGLPFRGTTFCRVDTSVGSVSITPRAFVQGTVKPSFNITAGQTFIFNPNGTGNVTATFAAAAATHTGTAGDFNDFVGGEVLEIAFEDDSTTEVVFQAGDTTLNLIVARINLAFGATVAFNASSELRLTSTVLGTGSHLTIAASAVATTLGLTAATYDGSGDFADISIATFAETKAKLEAASALVAFTLSADGYPRIVSKLGGTGTMAIGAGTANTALGFTSSTSATAALATDVTIPAGTRCTDASDSTDLVVTMQTKSVLAGSVATTNVKVRPAVDDGSYLGDSAADIDTLLDAPSGYEWSVTNSIGLTAALTASQLDSAYLTAIAKCKGVSSDITKKISGIVSARTSNIIRAATKTSAVDCSASGHYGRRGFVCPPNGTSAAVIIGATAPGVGAYRVEEVSYCAGGIRCFRQEMIDGGYSTDGFFTRHPDIVMASRWSVLTPGYNPGQLPEEPKYQLDQTFFFGLESAAAQWDTTTYTAFHDAGVCGAAFDSETGITFEQGITAVSPTSDPRRVDIGRKTLADFIGDTFANFAKPQAKRQGTEGRRNDLELVMTGFLNQLVGDTIEANFRLTHSDGPAPKIVIYTLAADMIDSDDSIVLNLKVGPNAVQLSRG